MYAALESLPTSLARAVADGPLSGHWALTADDSKVTDFSHITGASPNQAQFYLDAAGGNLEVSCATGAVPDGAGGDSGQLMTGW